MIKPYLKNEHNANLVEVEDFGVINLNELPIRVRLDEVGHYEIRWIAEYGKDNYELSEVGGVNAMSYGGRQLGVIREIE